MKREKIETKTIVKGSVVEEKVPFMSKFTVSFADGMTATLNGLITASGLTYYYVTYLGLSSSWASFAWILFGIWNAINDPIFGFITDHTHSKLGRRIPFIRYGAPLIAAAFILTWFPWDAASQGWLMAQMLICLFLFDTLYTAIASALYASCPLKWQLRIKQDLASLFGRCCSLSYRWGYHSFSSQLLDLK